MGTAIQLKDIVYPALRLIGLFDEPGRGYLAGGSLEKDALAALNALCDSWFAERLSIFTVEQQVFTLTASKQAYNMGIDAANPTHIADFQTERPEHIEKANIITNVAGGPSNHTPLRIVEYDEWSSKRVLAVTSTIPTDLYCDYDAPFAKIYLYPIPAIANQLELYHWRQIAVWLTANDLIQLPPGYLRALQYALAVDLAPRYPRRAVLSPVVMETADKLKNAIWARNSPSLKMTVDPALSGSGAHSGWSYLTGDS